MVQCGPIAMRAETNARLRGLLGMALWRPMRRNMSDVVSLLSNHNATVKPRNNTS